MDQFNECNDALLVGDASPPIARKRKISTVTKRSGHYEATLNEQQDATIGKIRVLLVITGLASGGATNVVLDLANHLKNHPEFALKLVTGPPPPGRTDVTHLAHEMGINIEVLPNLVNHINPLTNLKALADLRRIMVQGNYDIVHTHSSVAGIVGRFAAFSTHVPAVIHHVHGWALEASESRLIRALYLNLERICARFTDRLVVVSKPDIKTGVAHRIAGEKKFTLIYNGIDLEKFRQPVVETEVRRQLGLDPDAKLVGMIGRLDRQKNPLDFIRSAAIVSRARADVQFLIVGDGSLRPECERLIRDLKLEGRVFLLGYRDDVARILPILTMTAMSSLWEGLPIAFLEAMSAGKPIVANDVDGAADVVSEGETGFLVPPRQPAIMAERILCLLKDEAFCNEMSQCAQQRSDYFSVDRMVGEIESLYRELHFASGSFQRSLPNARSRRGNPISMFGNPEAH